MWPLESVVLGAPVSAQGRRRLSVCGKQRVRAAAESAAGAGHLPDAGAVALTVAYFYVYAPAADLDNIVKPIQDALIGFAYTNDIQVVDLVVTMRSKAAPGVIRMSPTLAEGFGGHSDFVHIVVDLLEAVEVDQ